MPDNMKHLLSVSFDAQIGTESLDKYAPSKYLIMYKFIFSKGKFQVLFAEIEKTATLISNSN